MNGSSHIFIKYYTVIIVYYWFLQSILELYIYILFFKRLLSIVEI